jgi:diguanylate cyclase (GGDEF)-like protein
MPTSRDQGESATIYVLFILPREQKMPGNREKLRFLYLVLCASQLLITGLGLVVAYQVHRAYVRNIDYEKSVNDVHRTIDELVTLARVASPGALVDEDTIPSQVSQIIYTSKVFQRKVQELVTETENFPNSPIARSQSDLRSMIAEMNTVAEQGQLASDAWEQNDRKLALARLTYVDRAATRVQATLGNINLQMSRTKEEMLQNENVEARRASDFLRPLAIVGILLVLPALLYARQLDRNIWAYEDELESHRNLLEQRVTTRTSELQTEIDYRKRLEFFNDGRNRLMEQVVEDRNLDEVLSELALMTEESAEESRCVILLDRPSGRAVIAPNVPPDLVASLQEVLLPEWENLVVQKPEGALYIAGLDPKARVAFGPAWSQGFRGILAVPITEPRRPGLGIVLLLLREPRDPGGFAREVVLSTSRIATVALEHDRMQGELFRRAHHDPLTNLPNLGLFEDRLQQAVALADRRKTNVGVLCIDLDGFKPVNDGYGHHAGDWLLQQVAQRLSAQLRKTDTLARLGGDEFVAVVHDTQEGVGVAKFVDSLVRTIAEPYSFGDVTLRVTASIGAALYPTDGNSSQELRRHADMAMYRAKERGGNAYQIFSADLGERIVRRKLVEGYIQEAYDQNEFELHYQPIFTLSRSLVGLEALIRLKRPELKCVMPAEFMLVAEQTGRVRQIGEWVIREACRQVKQWQQEGFAAVPIAVNVSAIQLACSNFAEQLERILQEAGLEPALLHVEITETAVMSDFDEVQRQLIDLANLGVHISIDDFGTGHSSLSYIHRLPIRTLKIDRSFVLSMMESQESAAIVLAIIAMAKSLGHQVIAEGVETEEQLSALAKAGCDLAQGYLFSRPLDAISISSILARQEDVVALS